MGNKRKKVLFLIHDLGPGGAEKVLVNLVNNMDDKMFDITVMSLFDVGINKQFLSSKIKYISYFPKMFPGNSHIMKLFTPRQLHKLFIKEKYDIEISYLEGPCARIISGCDNSDTKLITWIHREQDNRKYATASFRSFRETNKCYNRFHQIVCVSENVKQTFMDCLDIHVPVDVYYNTIESEKIRNLAKEKIEPQLLKDSQINLIGVGKLIDNKGFDRILRITKKLKEDGFPVHTYILGVGVKEKELQEYIDKNDLKENATLLGYQTNPYKYVANSDLFVCASYGEGFSTAATEALIVGTPVCTVEVSGMKEMLGVNNEYGLVTQNKDKELYKAIKYLLDNKNVLSDYRKKAHVRGKFFDTKNTVQRVENLLIQLSK